MRIIWIYSDSDNANMPDIEEENASIEEENVNVNDALIPLVGHSLPELSASVCFCVSVLSSGIFWTMIGSLDPGCPFILGYVCAYPCMILKSNEQGL